MKITNNLNLPDPVIAAIEKHEHSGGFISASQFTKSARQFWLEKRHSGEVVKDASDMIWSLFGTAFHKVLEDGTADGLSEHSLAFEVIDDITVSGTCDFYKDGKITDYKTISVWSVIYDSHRKDWETQLNVYAWLLRNAGLPVFSIEIVGFLRDWSKGKANDPSYPQAQVVVIPIILWDFEVQEKFVCDHVNNLLKYRDVSDEDLPECTPEERWATPDRWALMKEGRKSAVKLYDTETECDAAAHGDSKLSVQYRPGESKRCSYCDARDFCNQEPAKPLPV